MADMLLIVPVGNCTYLSILFRVFEVYDKGFNLFAGSVITICRTYIVSKHEQLKEIVTSENTKVTIERIITDYNKIQRFRDSRFSLQNIQKSSKQKQSYEHSILCRIQHSDIKTSTNFIQPGKKILEQFSIRKNGFMFYTSHDLEL